MNTFDAVRRMIRGYGDAVDVAAALGCCYNTAANRMKHPEDLTLGELQKIAKRFRIPAEEMQRAVRWQA